jgi:hypothetical protein
MLCERCGNTMSEEAAFCMYCGTAVERRTQPLSALNDQFTELLRDIQFPQIAPAAARRTAPPTSIMQEQVSVFVSDFEGVQQEIRRIQHILPQIANTSGGVYTKLEQARVAIEAQTRGSLVPALQASVLRGAPTDKVMQSFEQWFAAFQRLNQTVQSISESSQAFERSSEALVRSIEAVIVWLKHQA